MYIITNIRSHINTDAHPAISVTARKDISDGRIKVCYFMLRQYIQI